MLSIRIVLYFSFSLYSVFYRKLALLQTKSRSQKRVDKDASETNEAKKKGIQYAKTKRKFIRAKTHTHTELGKSKTNLNREREQFLFVPKYPLITII